MKKHLIYLVSAIIAVSFVFVSCSEDENGNNYNGNGYYNGGDPVCPPDCTDDCCYTPEPVDPCKELQTRVTIASADSAAAASKFENALLPAMTTPFDLSVGWWGMFNGGQFGNAESFRDSVNMHITIGTHFINLSEQAPAIQENVPNIQVLISNGMSYLSAHTNAFELRQKLYKCREENN